MGLIDRNPVVQSLLPVIEASRHVRTHPDAIAEVASWMAYEEFTLPGDMFLFPLGDDPGHVIDVLQLSNSLDFAFTDFSTSVKFQTEYRGETWSDSDAMNACIDKALEDGVPMTDGAWQARCSRDDLARIFSGNIEMPMLDERVEMLHEIGRVLVDRFDGRWSAWAATCDRALYAGGNGMLERIQADFPRYHDVSLYDGREVQVLKLAQLGLWGLHATWRSRGEPGFPDLDRMSAFADYIVPVGLRLMGLTSYSDELEARINRGDNLPRDSEEEIEIRAHTLYATALLTDACNALRPADMQLVIPQIDYRFWKPFHTTHWPHHLTRTVMY
jgi:hypothetical protein